MKRHFFRRFFCLFGGLMLWMTPPVWAAEELGTVEEYLPQELTELLGNTAVEQLSNGVAPSVSELLNLLFRQKQTIFAPAIHLFATLLGIFVLLSVIRSATDSTMSDGVGKMAGILSITAAIWQPVSALWNLMTTALRTVHTMQAALIPAMGTLLVLGGNTTAATVQTGGMTLLLGILEAICNHGLGELLQIGFALCFLSTCCFQNVLENVMTTVKKTLTWGLSLCCGIMLLALGCQEILAVSADNAAAKTVKFAAGNLIPVIGGACGDAVRTVMASLGLLRASVGIAGIFSIAILLLPPLCALFCMGLALRAGSFFGGLLGCSREARFLNSLSEILQTGMAILCAVGLLFLFLLTVFCKTAGAYT